MTDNVLQYWSEMYWIWGGALVLLLFGVTLGLRRHRAKILPGSKGHRPREQAEAAGENRPDGYIDRFAGEIEEAGGGMPMVVKVTVVGVLAWWVFYLIAYWTPR